MDFCERLGKWGTNGGTILPISKIPPAIAGGNEKGGQSLSLIVGTKDAEERI